MSDCILDSSKMQFSTFTHTTDEGVETRDVSFHAHSEDRLTSLFLSGEDAPYSPTIVAQAKGANASNLFLTIEQAVALRDALTADIRRARRAAKKA